MINLKYLQVHIVSGLFWLIMNHPTRVEKILTELATMLTSTWGKSSLVVHDELEELVPLTMFLWSFFVGI